MIDEMTDAAIGEQAVIIVRWVGEDRQVHEEFVGLYSVPQTEAGTITEHCNNGSLRQVETTYSEQVSGECYEGAGNLSGKRMALLSACRR